MREVLPDRGEVVSQRREMLVSRWFEEQGKFCLVDLEAVHLLVEEGEAPDYCVRMEQFPSCGAQPCIAGEGLVLFEPSSDGPLRHLEMSPLAEFSLRICESVAEIEGGNGVKNCLEGVGLALARCAGESR